MSFFSFYVIIRGIATETLKSDVLVYSTGTVFRVPQLRIEFTCRMNFRFFPYDEQVCLLKFGSWHLHADKIDLLSDPGSAAELMDYHHVRDFIISKFTATKNTVQYPCCPELYADMSYEIHLRRVSDAYNVKLVLPASLTGFLVLATFLLPPASHEKITLCGLLFLCLLLQLSYLHDIVPSSGNTMLGDYLAFVLFIDFFATAIAVASHHIHTSSSSQKQTVMEMEGDANDLKIQQPKDVRSQIKPTLST